MKQRLLKPFEASAYLGLAEPTLRNSRLTGTLCGRKAPPYIKMGYKSVFYDQNELDTWIEALPRYTSTAESTSTQKARTAA